MIVQLVMILYIPVMTLLLYIVVVSSEGVLKSQSKMLPSLILKKTIQKTMVQLRKQIATMDPTPFLEYSRKRISVYIVNHKERRN